MYSLEEPKDFYCRRTTVARPPIDGSRTAERRHKKLVDKNSKHCLSFEDDVQMRNQPSQFAFRKDSLFQFALSGVDCKVEG